MSTPILALQEIAEGVASQASLHNQALRELEARSVRVLSMTTTAPPGSPAESDSYIIPTGSPMTWLGAADQIAVYLGAAWSYYTPVEGVTVWVNDLNALYTYNGAAWDATVAATSPLTTKGDVYTYSSINARVGVGANATVLTADSAEATGLKWAAPELSPIKWGGVATYGSNNYLLDPSPVPAGYTTYDTYLVYIPTQNSSNDPTMQPTGDLGQSAILNPDGSATTPGDVRVGFQLFTFDAGWKMHKPSGAVGFKGDETIGGIKTFTSPIIIPDGVAATDGVTLRQVPGRSVIINGAMRIAQRGTSFAAVAGGAYTLDRWIYIKSGAMVHTVTQNTDVPTVAQSGVLLPYSLRLNLTTADTAIAAGDYCAVGQYIEGYNFQRIAQRVFTVSFWVKATLAGTYSLTVNNSVSDRSYVSNFTISSTATWEFKTITVLASPSAGTWNYANGIGLSVYITLAAGSTFQTTANAWQTGNFLGSASNVNGVNTGATDFRIAGIQVEPGSVATAFDMPLYDQGLESCRRYYRADADDGSGGYAVAFLGQATSTTNANFPIALGKPMRITPAFSISAASDFLYLNAAGSGAAASALVRESGSLKYLVLNMTGTGLVAGNAVLMRGANVNARMNFDAEL